MKIRCYNPRCDLIWVHIISTILIILMLAAAVLCAPNKESRTLARDRCALAAKDVLPEGWLIVTVDEPTWRRLKKKYDLPPDALTAFTDIHAGWTVVRERYALTATNERLRHTMAHEGGHVACQCASEDVATMWAWEHEGLTWGVVAPGEIRTLGGVR